MRAYRDPTADTAIAHVMAERRRTLQNAQKRTEAFRQENIPPNVQDAPACKTGRKYVRINKALMFIHQFNKLTGKEGGG